VAKDTPQKEHAVPGERSGDRKSAPDDAADAPSARDHPAARPAGDAKDPRDARDAKDTRDARDVKEAKDINDAKQGKDDKDSITVAGRIAARTIDIRALSGGMIRATRIQDGQRVKQGELLVQLDDDVDVAQILAAEADLKLKTAALERAKALYKEREAPVAEVDGALANVEIAQVALKYRKAVLAQHRITAPFDGVIVNAKAQVGQVISGADAVLATLIDLDHPTVEFSVSEMNSTQIAPGAKVTVSVPALKRKFTGKVTVVADQVNPETGTVVVKTTLDGPTEGVKPGMYAVVALEAVKPATKDARE
jgi:RND family efflux transporter MFP subunit